MQDWRELMRQIVCAADMFEESALAETAGEAMQESPEAVLNILVAARPGAGGWQIAVETAGGPDSWIELDGDWFPAATLSAGTANTFMTEYANGLKQYVQAAEVRPLVDQLQALEPDAGRLPRNLSLTTRADAAHLPVVRWIRLDWAWSDEDWRRALATADFVLLVTREDQILTREERNFLSRQIVEQFGLARCALVIHQSEAVTAEQKSQVRQALEHYLGELAAEPVIVEYGNGSGEIAGLRRYLLDSFQAVKQGSFAVTARICSNALARAAGRKRDLIAAAGARNQFEQKRRKADEDKKTAAVERLTAAIEFRFLSVLRERYDSEIREFGAALRADIVRDIHGARDLRPAIRMIPHYLSDLWSHFLLPLLARLERDMAAEYDTVFAEAEQLHLGAAVPTAPAQPKLQTSLYSSLRRTPFQARSSRWASFMGIAGLWMVWQNPVFGLSLLGASKGLQWLSHREEDAAHREQLAESAIHACLGIETRVQKDIGRILEAAVAPAREGLKAACGLAVETPSDADIKRWRQVLEAWPAMSERIERGVQEFEQQWRQSKAMAASSSQGAGQA